VPSRAADPNAAAILEEVRATLSAIGLRPQDVAPSTRLVDDLDLDSLDWVDLALRLEAALEVELRDEKLASLVTVQDVIDLIGERLAVRPEGRA
jgi:acyl carrier protein